MENCKIIQLNTEDIPLEYFNETYAYLSFSMINDKAIHLYLATLDAERTKFLILDLRRMSPSAKRKCSEFLKTIKIRNDRGLCLEYDLEFAKSKFGVDIEVVKKGASI